MIPARNILLSAIFLSMGLSAWGQPLISDHDLDQSATEILLIGRLQSGQKIKAFVMDVSIDSIMLVWDKTFIKTALRDGCRSCITYGLDQFRDLKVKEDRGSVFLVGSLSTDVMITTIIYSNPNASNNSVKWWGAALLLSAPSLIGGWATDAILNKNKLRASLINEGIKSDGTYKKLEKIVPQRKYDQLKNKPILNLGNIIKKIQSDPMKYLNKVKFALKNGEKEIGYIVGGDHAFINFQDNIEMIIDNRISLTNEVKYLELSSIESYEFVQ